MASFRPFFTVDEDEYEDKYQEEYQDELRTLWMAMRDKYGKQYAGHVFARADLDNIMKLTPQISLPDSKARLIQIFMSNTVAMLIRNTSDKYVVGMISHLFSRQALQKLQDLFSITPNYDLEDLKNRESRMILGHFEVAARWTFNERNTFLNRVRGYRAAIGTVCSMQRQNLFDVFDPDWRRSYSEQPGPPMCPEARSEAIAAAAAEPRWQAIDHLSLGVKDRFVRYVRMGIALRHFTKAFGDGVLWLFPQDHEEWLMALGDTTQILVRAIKAQMPELADVCSKIREKMSYLVEAEIVEDVNVRLTQIHRVIEHDEDVSMIELFDNAID